MPTLEWIGKKAVVNHHREVPTRLLHCDPAHSFGDHDAGNLLVQGDNLEALKALLPFYAGKVKCIYIDPPYNTGNEGWVYNDNVNSPEIRAWLDKVVGKEGEDLSRHDKWLCMMYPRLRLLKDFLAPDGVLFASCDNHELPRLTILLQELLAPGALSIIPVVNNMKGRNDQANIAQCHEYVLMFARPGFVAAGLPLSDNQKKKFRFSDDSGELYDLRDLRKRGGADTRILRPNLFFPLFLHPDGSLALQPRGASDVEITPQKSDGTEGAWRWGKGKVQANLKLLSASQVSKSGRWNISYRVYLDPALAPLDAGEIDDEDDGEDYDDETGEPVERSTKPKSFWWGPELSTDRAGKHIKKLTGGVGFDYPKPVDLIRKLIYLAGDRDALILDSFAGSGTTAEAVLKVNAEDGGSRRFIVVEMDEKISTRLTKVRIEAAAKAISPEAGIRFCRLGVPLFDELGSVNADVAFNDLAAFVFFADTGSPIPKRADANHPLIGTFQGRAIYLLYVQESQGVPSTKFGNVLTPDVLSRLPAPEDGFDGPRIVYAEGCTVPPERLAALGVTFKQIPYQLEGL